VGAVSARRYASRTSTPCAGRGWPIPNAMKRDGYAWVLRGGGGGGRGGGGGMIELLSRNSRKHSIRPLQPPNQSKHQLTRRVGFAPAENHGVEKKQSELVTLAEMAGRLRLPPAGPAGEVGGGGLTAVQVGTRGCARCRTRVRIFRNAPRAPRSVEHAVMGRCAVPNEFRRLNAHRAQRRRHPVGRRKLPHWVAWQISSEEARRQVRSKIPVTAYGEVPSARCKTWGTLPDDAPEHGAHPPARVGFVSPTAATSAWTRSWPRSAPEWLEPWAMEIV